MLERIAPRHPGRALRGGRRARRHEELRRTVRERGWRLPGRLRPRRCGGEQVRASAVCPTVTFADARRGGRADRARVPRRARADHARGGARAGPAAAMSEEEPPLVAVAIDARVAEEHPGLRVWTTRIDARTARTPPELRDRLRLLADRFRGPEAIAMRARPVPWAYRVLYRHLGIDPDVVRTPIEELVLERLLTGGFAPAGCPRTRSRSPRSRPACRYTRRRRPLEGTLALAPDAGGRLVLPTARAPSRCCSARPSRTARRAAGRVRWPCRRAGAGRRRVLRRGGRLDRRFGVAYN